MNFYKYKNFLMYILLFQFSKYVWQEKVFRNGSLDHGFYNFESKRFFFSFNLW